MPTYRPWWVVSDSPPVTPEPGAPTGDQILALLQSTLKTLLDGNTAMGLALDALKAQVTATIAAEQAAVDKITQHLDTSAQDQADVDKATADLKASADKLTAAAPVVVATPA